MKKVIYYTLLVVIPIILFLLQFNLYPYFETPGLLVIPFTVLWWLYFYFYFLFKKSFKKLKK